MTNVLPEPYQKNIWRMYRGRFVIAGAALALAAAALALLALLPSYLALHADENALSSAPTSGMGVRDQTDILHAQSLLAALAPLTLATTTPSQVVAEALALRPKGVSVDHITYTSGSVILDGAAASRESVNAYKKVLGADARFTSVSVPLSDLTGAGGHFSLTLLGDF